MTQGSPHRSFIAPNCSHNKSLFLHLVIVISFTSRQFYKLASIESANAKSSSCSLLEPKPSPLFSLILFFLFLFLLPISFHETLSPLASGDQKPTPFGFIKDLQGSNKGDKVNMHAGDIEGIKALYKVLFFVKYESHIVLMWDFLPFCFLYKAPPPLLKNTLLPST